MTEWLKGCEICNAGLCARFDELIKEGLSQRKAAKHLESEQEKALGAVIYPAETLRTRLKRNKPSKVGTNIPIQKEPEVKTQGKVWDNVIGQILDLNHYIVEHGKFPVEASQGTRARLKNAMSGLLELLESELPTFEQNHRKKEVRPLIVSKEKAPQA